MTRSGQLRIAGSGSGSELRVTQQYQSNPLGGLVLMGAHRTTGAADSVLLLPGQVARLRDWLSDWLNDLPESPPTPDPPKRWDPATTVDEFHRALGIISNACWEVLRQSEKRQGPPLATYVAEVERQLRRAGIVELPHKTWLEIASFLATNLAGVSANREVERRQQELTGLWHKVVDAVDEYRHLRGEAMDATRPDVLAEMNDDQPDLFGGAA